MPASCMDRRAVGAGLPAHWPPAELRQATGRQLASGKVCGNTCPCEAVPVFLAPQWSSTTARNQSASAARSAPRCTRPPAPNGAWPTGSRCCPSGSSTGSGTRQGAKGIGVGFIAAASVGACTDRDSSKEDWPIRDEQASAPAGWIPDTNLLRAVPSCVQAIMFPDDDLVVRHPAQLPPQRAGLPGSTSLAAHSKAPAPQARAGLIACLAYSPAPSRWTSAQ